MTTPELNERERPGASIGRYRLVQRIGEGGFGVVWMAEQEEPVKRRVALKVLKLGMDTAQVVARFEAERQALARMDHTHIAKVLDGGATEHGRPYFVMELVPGVAITKFCDDQKLGARARLELFQLVCRAVQHAHQKGVIHRDLKPSNVLVALEDGMPKPKVIDFGIAKATAGSLTERTLVTEFRQFLGTPEYMAPEQAEHSGLDIDTRADVYSLGVLLYELMTGTKPFDLRTIERSGYEEILRHIREVEPPKPSTRVSTLDYAGTVAAHRGLAKPELLRALSGDLDWIVMKALEKDRARRYDTANALADDVERHLADEPVLASPPSTLYRLTKFARRNRLAVGAGAVVLVALVAGLAIAGAGLVQARAQLRRAQTAEAEQARLLEAADAAREAESAQRLKAEASELTAHTAASKSQEVARFLSDMLKSVGPSVALGRDTELLTEILDQTAARLDSELAGQPEVEASLRETVGEVYRALGRYREAETMQREALRLRRELAGGDSADVAISLNNLSLAQFQRGDFADAERSGLEAIEVMTRVAPHMQQELLAFTGNVAAAQTRLGKYAEVEVTLRKLLELERARTGPESADTALALNNLGVVLKLRGDFAGAESALRESLGILRVLYGDHSPEAAMGAVNLSTALRALEQFDEAEELMREALATQRDVLGADHPELATTLNNLACVLYDRERYDEAHELFEQAVAMRRELLGADNVEVARPIEWLSMIARERREFARAEELALEAISIYERTLGSDHPDTVNVLDMLGHTLEEAGRPEEALPLLRRSFEAMQRNGQAWQSTDNHWLCYSHLLLKLERWPPAETALRYTWKRIANDPPARQTRAVLEALVELYDGWNRADPSERRAKESAEWRARLASQPLSR